MTWGYPMARIFAATLKDLGGTNSNMRRACIALVKNGMDTPLAPARSYPDISHLGPDFVPQFLPTHPVSRGLLLV